MTRKNSKINTRSWISLDTELTRPMHRLLDNEISGHHAHASKQLDVVNWF